MQFNEEKFSTLEEKTADALEMAAQANEEREAQASSASSGIILFYLIISTLDSFINP